MKIVYFDKKDNTNIYLQDNPYCRVRIIFTDDNNTYLFCSNDFNSQIYINRVLDITKSPHIFFTNNLEAIADDEQFDYYYKRLNNISNYQGLHKFDGIDGDNDNTILVLPNNVELINDK